MTTLLISDLHLSPERPEITQAFFDFLDTRAAAASELYILGDLFEAWIGDDDPSELAVSVQQRLSALSDKSVAVFFMAGNRDFAVGKRFARATGCTLLPDYHVATLNGAPTLLLHGDTLCTGDKAYQRFRRRIRNPIVLWLMKRLPLSKRQKIASDWRQKSTMANANKPENIMDVSTEAVEQTMTKFAVNRMIHGHTHRPNRHRHGNGERIVLGDWGEQGWYIEANDRQVALQSFALK